MISCRDCWPRTKPGYITMTRRQSNNQWSGGIAAYPAPSKNPSAEIRWKSSRLDFLGSRRHPPHWLSSEWPNYQREYYSSLVVQLQDILNEKRRPREGHQGGLVLARQYPGSPGTYNPEENGLLGIPMSLSPPPYSPDLASSDYLLFPGLKKTIEKSPFFVRRGGHCCRGDVVGRKTFWNFFFFLVACKS